MPAETTLPALSSRPKQGTRQLQGLSDDSIDSYSNMAMSGSASYADNTTARSNGNTSGRSKKGGTSARIDEDGAVLARVVRDRKASGDEELTLRIGDVVKVLSTKRTGYLKCEFHDDVGYVPSSYLEFFDETAAAAGADDTTTGGDTARSEKRKKKKDKKKKTDVTSDVEEPRKTNGDRDATHVTDDAGETNVGGEEDSPRKKKKKRDKKSSRRHVEDDEDDEKTIGTTSTGETTKRKSKKSKKKRRDESSASSESDDDDSSGRRRRRRHRRHRSSRRRGRDSDSESASSTNESSDDSRRRRRRRHRHTSSDEPVSDDDKRRSRRRHRHRKSSGSEEEDNKSGRRTKRDDETKSTARSKGNEDKTANNDKTTESKAATASTTATSGSTTTGKDTGAQSKSSARTTKDDETKDKQTKTTEKGLSNKIGEKMRSLLGGGKKSERVGGKSSSGILNACPNTVQGEEGWYEHGENERYYFILVDGKWSLLYGPMTEGDFEVYCQKVLEQNRPVELPATYLHKSGYYLNLDFRVQKGTS